MAKHLKSDEKLSRSEWERLARDLVQTIANRATKNQGAAAALARATDMSQSSIAQMKRTGKASIPSFLRVAAYLAGLTDREVRELLVNPVSILKNLEPASEIESLFNEIRGFYSDNELAAWLKLLRSKHQVEENLGITVKASDGKPKRKKS